jgi:hypothetical protein
VTSEQLSAPATPQTQSPGPDTVETPLFNLDTPSPVIDHPFLIDQDPPSPPSPPLLPVHQVKHKGGIQFQETTHKQAWDMVNSWVENQHCMLPESWVTTRYGSTELQPLIYAMTQEVLQGKCFFSPFHLHYRQC